MKNPLLFAPVTAVTLLLAACGSNAPVMDDAMQADLAAASAATIEMAPRGQGTQVVSAIESKQPQQPKLTPVRRVNAPARTPRPETPQVTQRTAESSEPTAVRPSTTPAVQPPPPGGYKSVGEVIRNAPFPIKP